MLREFTRELVSRGEEHLETLSIKCGSVQNEDIVALADMIKKNHKNGGHLSGIRFLRGWGDVCCEGVSDEAKERLESVLQVSKIYGRLELKGLSILSQIDVIYFPVDKRSSRERPSIPKGLEPPHKVSHF